jgi:hypothetical protein
MQTSRVPNHCWLEERNDVSLSAHPPLVRGRPKWGPTWEVVNRSPMNVQFSLIHKVHYGRFCDSVQSRFSVLVVSLGSYGIPFLQWLTRVVLGQVLIKVPEET